MSLAKCLLKHRELLKNLDTSEIKAGAEEYVKSGMTQQEAERKAVDDKLSEIKLERSRINKEIQKQYKERYPDAEQEQVAAKKETLEEYSKSRNLDTVLSDAIDGKASVKELLTHIHRSTQDPFYAAYAKYLMPFMDGVTVVGGDVRKDVAAGVVELKGDYSKIKLSEVQGMYNGHTKIARIYTTRQVAKVLLHELTHAATLKALDRFSWASDEMHNLYEYAKGRVDNPGKTYGFHNVSEFVAEAFSNPDFQSLLQSIPPMRNSANLWAEFKKIIAKILKLGDEVNSVFDQVMAVSEHLINENAAIENGSSQTPMVASVSYPPAATTLEALGNSPKFIDTLGHLRRGVMRVQFLNDLKDNYGHLLQDENGNSVLAAYVTKAKEMGSTANDLLKAGGTIAERWNELKAEKRVINQLAVDATTSGMRPGTPLDLQDHVDKDGRVLSNKHLADEDGKFSQEVQDKHAELAARFAAMSDRARKSYTDARNHMMDSWNKREELLNKRVMETYGPLIDEARRLGNEAKAQELEQERDGVIDEYGTTLARIDGDYFPLSRFGDYYVVYKSADYQAAEQRVKEAKEASRELYTKYDIPVGSKKELEALEAMTGKKMESLTPAEKLELKEARKEVQQANKALRDLVSDGEHYSNEAFETEGKATLRAKELGVNVMLKEDYFRQLSPATKGFIEKVANVATGALPEKQAAYAREALMQMWIKSLPDSSAMRSQLKRQKVAGYSTDMLRAFSKVAQTDAHYLSRLQHMDDLLSNLTQMERVAKEGGLKAQEVYNEVARRHVEGMTYTDNPTANLLSATSFVFQLSINPGFLLSNLSQPWMLSMPMMAARHGMFQSNSSLAKAFGEVGKTVKTAIKENKSFFFEIDKSKFSKGEQAMFERGQREGLMDYTLETDLSAISQMDSNDKDSAKGKMVRFNRMMSIVPHQLEVINRVTTALAAYRMELKKTGSDTAASDYAMKILDKTHFDYSSTNAPSFLKPGFIGGWGKVLFQYRKYQLGAFSLIANQWKEATNGSTEAKRALLGLFTMHGLMAGALGMPLAGSAVFIANMLNKVFGDDDQPWDAEVAFRNWLADTLGVEEGSVAAKGLPMLAGMDVSQKVGLGSIAAPIQVMRGNKKGRDFWAEVLMAGLGPTLGGLAPQFADGIKLIGQGDTLKGSEKMLPVFLTNFLRAYRESTEGVTTGKGVVSIAPGRIDAWDTTLRSLGITPSVISERGAAVGAVENLKSALKDRSSELQRDWVSARVKGDSEAVASAMEAIDAYNAVRKSKGEPTIKPVDLINAYKQRTTAEKNTNQQGVQLNKKSKGLAEQGRFADVS